MRRRRFLGGAAGGIGATLAAPHVAAARAAVLHFIPQGDLNTLDPVWLPAPNVRTHGYMVFDTLYGMDVGFRPVPQMVEGATIEDHGRSWRLTLRPGLMFHDGTPVRARDCVASIRRFWARDPFGQALAAVTDELSAADDRTIRFRLSRAFRLLPDVLASTPLFMPAMMPERLALTDPRQQVNEMVGSGPFRFVRDEQVSGARYVYARFDGYRPRDGGELGWTGGPKRVHLERVEWNVIPDPATAFAALEVGEADWWEYADFDLLDRIRESGDLVVQTTDPTGMKADLRMNQAIPPFDNPEIRRALLGAIDQRDFCNAMVGTDPARCRWPVGFFVPVSPMASDVGLENLTAPRDLAAAAAKIKAAGYKGETVVILSASNIATTRAASLVAADLLRRLGMTVDYQEMDWGTLAARRRRREGWNIWILPGPGLAAFNPAETTLLRTGPQAYYGWPKSERLEAFAGPVVGGVGPSGPTTYRARDPATGVHRSPGNPARSIPAADRL